MKLSVPLGDMADQDQDIACNAGIHNDIPLADIWLVDIDNVSICKLNDIPPASYVYLFGNKVDCKNIRLSLTLLEKIVQWSTNGHFFLYLTGILRKNSADFLMCFHAAHICIQHSHTTHGAHFHICSRDHGFDVLKNSIVEFGNGRFNVTIEE